MAPDFLGAVFALISALVWGGGDFSGGLATRRAHQFQVLVISTLSGIGILVICAWLWGESLPDWPDTVWAMGAGLTGVIGLAALYRGLSLGNAASVAPTAAVITAALPVVFTLVVSGSPAPQRLIGFVLAFMGIWLVSRSGGVTSRYGHHGLPLAYLAGVSFGAFFILIAQVKPGLIFTPLVVARSFSFFVGLLLLWGTRQPFPSLLANPIALLAGILDASGNIFYLLARQYTRLDVAAVLASLFPATTVLLSRLILHEQINHRQWLGVIICLLAIILITL